MQSGDHSSKSMNSDKYSMVQVRRRKIIFTTLLVLAVIFGAVLHLRPFASTGSTVIWNQQAGQPVDASSFYVILFPTDNSNTRVDNNNPIGNISVRRAVLVSLDELDQNVISVFADHDNEVRVPSNMLTAFPPSERENTYISKLNDIIKTWQSATDWRNVVYESKSIGDDKRLVTLVIYTKRGDVYDYVYDVDSNGRIFPRSVNLRKRRL